jgi:hypothetical protein
MGQDKPLCLIADCNRKAMSRGLCESHYSLAKFAVMRGETSWRELMDLGLCKVSNAYNRKAAFHKLLDDRRSRAKESQ